MKKPMHINPVYPWYCGTGVVGLNTTNTNDVTCPDCLALKPNVLNITSDHPLIPFFNKVLKEYERGKVDYGDWADHDEEWQKNAVKSECLEWMACSLKTRRAVTREMEELTHLANVSGKRWIELNKKEK